MSYVNQDLKLKNLVIVCKKTGNLKKLAVVIFEVTSNRLDEIGLRLGIKRRKHKSGETLVEYMEMINQVIYDNFGIQIFHDKIIEKIEECEPLFLKNRGDIPYDNIRTMFKEYFKLRELDVPNLHREMDESDLVNISEYGFHTFLSPTSKKKRSNLKPLILQKIKEQKRNLQKQSQDMLRSYVLEKAILLKKFENSLNNNGKRDKIKFTGKLKDNLNYQQSIESIVGYFIIGVSILLFTLGMSMFLKLMTYSDLPSSLNYWSLLFVGGGAILLIVYINSFIRRR